MTEPISEIASNNEGQIDSDFSKYFRLIDQKNLARLSSTIGQKAVDWLDTQGLNIYLANWNLSSFNKAIGDLPESVFYIPYERWMFELHKPTNTKKSDRIVFSFLFRDDSIDKVRETIEHPFSLKYIKDDKYKESKSTLQDGTLGFLRLAKRFIEQINLNCTIAINPSNKQRERIYRSALSKFRNVYINSTLK